MARYRAHCIGEADAEILQPGREITRLTPGKTLLQIQPSLHELCRRPKRGVGEAGPKPEEGSHTELARFGIARVGTGRSSAPPAPIDAAGSNFEVPSRAGRARHSRLGTSKFGRAPEQPSLPDPHSVHSTPPRLEPRTYSNETSSFTGTRLSARFRMTLSLAVLCFAPLVDRGNNRNRCLREKLAGATVPLPRRSQQRCPHNVRAL